MCRAAFPQGLSGSEGRRNDQHTCQSTLRRASVDVQHPVRIIKPAASMAALSMLNQPTVATVTMAPRMPRAIQARSWRGGVEFSPG